LTFFAQRPVTGGAEGDNQQETHHLHGRNARIVVTKVDYPSKTMVAWKYQLGKFAPYLDIVWIGNIDVTAMGSIS
jgi:hypothetical protein